MDSATSPVSPNPEEKPSNTIASVHPPHDAAARPDGSSGALNERLLEAASVRLGTEIDLSSPLRLRQTLQPRLDDGAAAWVRLAGLSLDDLKAHRGFCQAMTRCGIAAELGIPLPSIVVLDWSVVAQCGAEGLAYFRVLVEQFVRLGILVVVCEPSDAGLRRVFANAGMLAGLSSLARVPNPSSGIATCEALCQMTVFSTATHASLATFLDQLGSSLERLGSSRRRRQAIMGVAGELLQNILTHAGAMTGAAVATLLPRRRPKVVQVGVADDGIGIARSFLALGTDRDIQQFSDAMVTHVVLGRSLSGRGASNGERVAGGGLSRLFTRLLDEHPGTRVLLRSGEAFCALDAAHPASWKRDRLMAGGGTQVRLEVRLG